MKKEYSIPCICLISLTAADQLTTSFAQAEEGVGDRVNFEDLL